MFGQPAPLFQILDNYDRASCTFSEIRDPWKVIEACANVIRGGDLEGCIKGENIFTNGVVPKTAPREQRGTVKVVHDIILAGKSSQMHAQMTHTSGMIPHATIGYNKEKGETN